MLFGRDDECARKARSRWIPDKKSRWRGRLLDRFFIYLPTRAPRPCSEISAHFVSNPESCSHEARYREQVWVIKRHNGQLSATAVATWT